MGARESIRVRRGARRSQGEPGKPGGSQGGARKSQGSQEEPGEPGGARGARGTREAKARRMLQPMLPLLLPMLPLLLLISHQEFHPRWANTSYFLRTFFGRKTPAGPSVENIAEEQLTAEYGSVLDNQFASRLSRLCKQPYMV